MKTFRRKLKCPELLVYLDKSENYFAISFILSDQGYVHFTKKCNMYRSFHLISYLVIIVTG